uniref:Beta-ketoacyl synthase n=1 Tax=uncultured bacterium pEAF66 TaxID=480414 RepID=B0LFU1_9BACT|nr:beta-ketoacyl synthase [uncultured bacterium pEAF66]
MNTSADNTIVITGTGCLLPGSSTPAQFWDRLVQGESGLTPYSDERIGSRLIGHFGHLSAEQRAAAAEAVPFKLRRFASSCSMWGVKAATDALAHAGLDLKTIPDDRCGLFTAQGDYLHPSVQSFATGLGNAVPNDLPALTREFTHHRGMEPFMAIKSLANNMLAMASLTLGTRGDCGAFVQNKSATVAALRSAAFSLRHGYSDCALLICSGSYNEVLTLAELQRSGYLSAGAGGARSVRPFDRRRDGTIAGEGAVAFVLETAANARRRGAAVLATLGGIGNLVQQPGAQAGSDAYRRCADKALAGSGVDFGDIGAIVARGTGGQSHDAHEASLLAQLQQGRGGVPITCATPIVGSVPACPVDWLASIGILQEGVVPPIANLEDALDAGLHFVHGKPEQRDARHVLSLSAGYTGFHSAVLFSAASH